MRIVAEAVGDDTGHWFMGIAVLVIVSAAILWPFRRLKGGTRAADGGPGGAEKAIVGVLWLLGAIVLGIVLATR